MMDLNEMRKWAGEMESSAEALMTASGGDKHMMSAAFGSSRVSWLLSQAASEIEGLKRQRDELLEAAKLAIREIRPSTDCSMCHDSTWDHECDSKVNTTHVALSNAIKGAIAAEHPKPAGGGA